jgi:hypothetical protein
MENKKTLYYKVSWHLQHPCLKLMYPLRMQFGPLAVLP